MNAFAEYAFAISYMLVIVYLLHFAFSDIYISSRREILSQQYGQVLCTTHMYICYVNARNRVFCVRIFTSLPFPFMLWLTARRRKVHSAATKTLYTYQFSYILHENNTIDVAEKCIAINIKHSFYKNKIFL